jgi:hypothetical protein
VIGATAEWKRAAARERRQQQALLREVDPEVAEELERRELEDGLRSARKAAKNYRRLWGWDERDRQRRKRERQALVSKRPRERKPMSTTAARGWTWAVLTVPPAAVGYAFGGWVAGALAVVGVLALLAVIGWASSRGGARDGL